MGLDITKIWFFYTSMKTGERNKRVECVCVCQEIIKRQVLVSKLSQEGIKDLTAGGSGKEKGLMAVGLTTNLRSSDAFPEG